MIQVAIVYLNPPMSYYFKAENDHPPGERLRLVGKAIQSQFQLCGQILDTMLKDGWTFCHYCNGAYGQHTEVTTEDQARQRLTSIGVDLETVIVSNTWENFRKEVKEESSWSSKK